MKVRATVERSLLFPVRCTGALECARAVCGRHTEAKRPSMPPLSW